MIKMVTKFMPAHYVNSNTNQLQDLTGILGKEILSDGVVGSNENINLSRGAKRQHSAGPLSRHQCSNQNKARHLVYILVPNTTIRQHFDSKSVNRYHFSPKIYHQVGVLGNCSLALLLLFTKLSIVVVFLHFLLPLSPVVKTSLYQKSS